MEHTTEAPVRIPLHDLPPWASLAMTRAADGGVVVGALLAGALSDVAARAGGLAGAVLVAAASATLLVVGRAAGWQARAVTVLAALFGAMLAVRASPWLLALDVFAAGGLLVLGASLARGGSLLDLPLPGFAARVIHAALHLSAAPAFVHQGIGRLRGRTTPSGPGLSGDIGAPAAWESVLRGVALAFPILLVLGALLASADALFAHVLERALRVDDAWSHVALVVAGAWVMAGLLRLTAATSSAAVPRRFPVLDPMSGGRCPGAGPHRPPGSESAQPRGLRGSAQRRSGRTHRPFRRRLRG